MQHETKQLVEIYHRFQKPAIDENTCRKDFAPSEAVALGEKLEVLEKPKAEERKKESLNKGKARSGNLPQREKGKTRDVVGSAVGMSGKTYEKAKAVIEAENTLRLNLPGVSLPKLTACLQRVYSEADLRLPPIDRLLAATLPRG